MTADSVTQDTKKTLDIVGGGSSRVFCGVFTSDVVYSLLLSAFNVSSESNDSFSGKSSDTRYLSASTKPKVT